MVKLTNKFIIVIPLFNAQNSILKCISSVLKQKLNDVGIIIRDDMSTDTSLKVVRNFLGIREHENYTKKNGKDILLISNTLKFYGGGNTYDSAINYVDNMEAIIGVVDGDDYLISDLALTKVMNIYKVLDVWLVWSQHQPKTFINQSLPGYSNKLPANKIIYQDRNYWCVSHFRTCKAWLFHEIDRADLYDPFCPNLFCQFAADASIIYPIIEMCGNQKSFFMNEILYFYDDDLPSNENNISNQGVKRYSEYIRCKQNRYSRLKTRTVKETITVHLQQNKHD